MTVFKRPYKGIEIAVVQGDLTKQEVDAIVNPANSMLAMGEESLELYFELVGKRSKMKLQKRLPFLSGVLSQPTLED
jgi:hypothetical protein